MTKILRTAVVACTAGLALSCGSDGPAGPGTDDLAIVTESLTYASLTRPYAEGLDATGGGGGYSWEISAGALPQGIVLSVEDLSDDDALLTGVPEEEGNFSFTVQVRSQDGQTATRQFTLEVLPAPTPVIVQNSLLPPGLVDQPYGISLSATGGDTRTFSWSVVEGTLPAGLTLTEDGSLTGTPTATAEVLLTVEVTSGGEVARQSFPLLIAAEVADRFNLTALEVAPTPGAMRPALQEALDKWEGAITGDLARASFPIRAFTPNSCGGFGDALNGAVIDDLLVLVNIRAIDGPGGILGQAGPCGLRSLTQLPIAGVLTLDSEDLMPLVGTDNLVALLAHEIGHILGIGSLWETAGLVEQNQTDPRFSGPRAMAEWHALGGTGEVPVEDQGGSGTREVHWRESTFGSELMTGYIEPVGVPMPLSRVTVASLGDLGYAVDLNAADLYVWTGTSAAPAPLAGGALPGLADVYRGPVVVVGPGDEHRVIHLDRAERESR